MAKPIAGDEQIVQLTSEYTWMGGDPGGIRALLDHFEFERSAIESAIANVMSSHSCTSTYATAMTCKDLLETALAKMK